MWKRQLTAIVLISILFLTFSQFSRGQDQTAPTSADGWQVEEGRGGLYSVSNGIFWLRSNGDLGPGGNCTSMILYEQINPARDFTFSLQVNAKTPGSCGIFIRGSLPIAGSTDGCNFEYGHYGQGLFLLARNYSYWGYTSEWTPTQIAQGDPDVWYTMQLSVYSSPFKVTVSVLNENGSLLGTLSTSDITNFGFDDIKYIGFGVWGNALIPSDYLFRNIQDPFDNPASLTINIESTSITAGSAVNVFGKLSDLNNTALQNKTVVLSYTFPGAEAWIPISSAQTDEQGNYHIQWINSASGTFTLKTEWIGDVTHAYSSNSTTLNFLPIENKNTFVIESNSTVNELSFNNNTSTLSFNVTGPSGTTGYVKATIDKSLLADSEALQGYIDGKPLNYMVTSNDDSWIFAFFYSHSTHQITMHINMNTHVTEPSEVQPQGSEILLIGISILFVFILTILAVSLLRLRSKANKASGIS